MYIKLEFSKKIKSSPYFDGACTVAIDDGCFPDSLAGYSKAMTMRSFLTMMMLMIWVQNAQVSFRPSGLQQYIIAKAASRHRQQRNDRAKPTRSTTRGSSYTTPVLYSIVGCTPHFLKEMVLCITKLWNEIYNSAWRIRNYETNNLDSL